MKSGNYNDEDRGRINTCLRDTYVLERLLGKGGMATVYLGRDRTRPRRRVAIKILDDAYRNDRRMLRRFEREFEALRRLQGHPNVIRVYEFNASGEAAFMVMEYVKGETLRSRMRRKSCSPSEALEILAPIMSVLHIAHVAGVIVRDVKPENVILGRVPKLVDLGVAKLLDPFEDPADAMTILTKHDSVIGTPDYMAPEQARSSANVDRRCDIFSCACVLYEMVAGQKAFPRGTETETWSPPPSLHLIETNAPSGFAEAVTRGMSLDPDNRPQTMEQFLSELTEALTLTSFQQKRSQPVLMKSIGQAHTIVLIELELHKPLSLTLCVKKEASLNPPGKLLNQFKPLFDRPYSSGKLKHLTVEFQKDSFTFLSFPKPIVFQSDGTPILNDLVLDSRNPTEVVEYWPGGPHKKEKRYVVELSYGASVHLRLYEKTKLLKNKKKRVPLLEFILARKPSLYDELRPEPPRTRLADQRSIEI